MPSPLPEVLLVPGAGHGQSSMRFLRDQLQRLGYTVHTPTLPCFNCEPPTKTLLDDINLIKATIESVLEENKDIVVVAHSAGAITSGAAVCGFEKAKSGDKAGVVGLIYMSGMLLPKAGISVRDVFGNPPFEQHDGNYVRVPAQFFRDVFYSDVSVELTEHEIALSKHMPEGFWATKTPGVPWTEDCSTLPITYISYTEDAVFSQEKQKHMYSAIPGVKVREVKAGHMGVISQPAKTAKVIDQIIKEL